MSTTNLSEPELPAPPVEKEISAPVYPPDDSKNLLFILLGFLIIAISIAAAFIFWAQSTKSSTKAQITPFPTLQLVSTTPSPTLSLESTQSANWKTYIKNGAYSVMYPPQISVSSEAAEFSSSFTINNDMYSIGVTPSNMSGTRLYDLKPTAINQIVKNDCPDFSGKKSCSDTQPGPISNSVQFDTLNRHYASTNTVVKNGNVFYEIDLSINNPNIAINPKAKDLYNQILSTFKFLDQNQTDPTANWTTYKDTDVSFQIKYPEGWSLRKTYGVNIKKLAPTDRISGIDISNGLTYGSTLVVNIIDPKNNAFSDWMKIYSGETNPPLTFNHTFQGIPAIKTTYTRSNKPDGVHIYYEQGGQVVFLAYDLALIDDQTMVDQILSTFKFTN